MIFYFALAQMSVAMALNLVQRVERRHLYLNANVY